MKLKNKKTGEIGWLYCDHISIPKRMTVFAEDKDLSANHWDYNSLAELNKEWEDYIEPKSGIKDVWFPDVIEGGNNVVISFETKEEAEEAAEKLKAWKRLKDKGFSFNDWDWKYQNIGYNLDCRAISEDVIEAEKDLDLLFGGEE